MSMCSFVQHDVLDGISTARKRSKVHVDLSMTEEDIRQKSKVPVSSASPNLQWLCWKVWAWMRPEHRVWEKEALVEIARCKVELVPDRERSHEAKGGDVGGIAGIGQSGGTPNGSKVCCGRPGISEKSGGKPDKSIVFGGKPNESIICGWKPKTMGCLVWCSRKINDTARRRWWIGIAVVA